MKPRRHTRRAALSVLAFLMLAVGCGPQSGPRAPAPDRNRITPEEMTAVDPGMSALQVIQRLRPNWLQGRGATQVRGDEPAVPVYVNNQRTSTPLTGHAARDIREMQFLDSINATQRFGTGHTHGAIIIILK
jgi:hypothetical protein